MKNNYLYLSLSIAAILGFFIFQLPNLGLPYFWDESWVYGPAVRILEENKINMLPDALSNWHSRGHPLLFHNLHAIWLRFTENSIYQTHLFSLLISCLALCSVFALASKIFNPSVAFASVLLTIIQPMFLAQSTMVLPEIMVLLFTCLSLLFYFRKQLLLYLLCSASLILVKESGIILVLSLTLFHFLVEFKTFKKPIKALLTSLKIALPLLVFVLHLSLQKIYNGWFLYPEHTGMIKLNLIDVSKTFIKSAFQTLAISQLRIIYLIISVVSLFFLLKTNKFKLLLNECSALIIFIICFMIFSSMNFYSSRYMLCTIPLFIMISFYLLSKTLNREGYFISVTLLLFFIHLIFQPFSAKNDIDLGYRDCIKTDQKTINYLINNSYGINEQNTSFIFTNNFKNMYSGYITYEPPKNKSVKSVKTSYYDRTFKPDNKVIQKFIEIKKAKAFILD